MLLISGDVELNPGPCTHMTLAEVKAMKGITIGHLNICSLSPKSDDIRYTLLESHLDILCLSETWLTDVTSSGPLIQNGFSLLRQDRCLGYRSRGGGLLTFV